MDGPIVEVTQFLINNQKCWFLVDQKTLLSLLATCFKLPFVRHIEAFPLTVAFYFVCKRNIKKCKLVFSTDFIFGVLL